MKSESQSARSLIGDQSAVNPLDVSESIALNDHKIAFALRYCRDKEVLDIGCVQHNPENYRSKYWVHKALRSVAKRVVGLDLYRPGVEYLSERGFEIVCGDAQDFHLQRKFDVIMAGDIIEHLENFDGFIECCKEHMHDEGLLLITTPNPWYWRNAIKAALLPEVRVNPEHTCWLCPQTLRQLLARHDLILGSVTFGARYLSDRMLPLPSAWKCTTFHATAHK